MALPSIFTDAGGHGERISKMATNSTALKYAAGTYRYGAAVPEYAPDLPKRPEPQPEAIPAARPRENARTAVQGYSISLFSIFGTALVLVMLLFVVLAHLSFDTALDENLKLEKRLAGLEQQETRLKIEFESAFDLNEIERYAIEELGMVKPAADQVSVIDSAPKDRAVVIAPEKEEGIKGFGAFISSLLEYFK